MLNDLAEDHSEQSFLWHGRDGADIHLDSGGAAHMPSCTYLTTLIVGRVPQRILRSC